MPTDTIPTTTSLAPSTSPTSSITDRVSADKNLFLKLLLTQLKNQDPLNPMEDKEFIAQLAQFTSVEKLTSIEQKLTEMDTLSTSNKAISLIGKNVTVLDPDNTTEDGVDADTGSATAQGPVLSVRILGEKEPMLNIGGNEYPLSWIVDIR